MTDETARAPMTEAEADALAEKRNLELGRAGVTDRFYVTVEQPDGRWVLEERREKKGVISRLFDAMPNMPW